MSTENSAAAILAAVCDALHIGSAVRSMDVVMTNIGNLQRRSACLDGIERAFFTEQVPDEDDPSESIEECSLSWGATPEQYVETFGELLAARANSAQHAAEPAEQVVGAQGGVTKTRIRRADCDIKPVTVNYRDLQSMLDANLNAANEALAMTGGIDFIEEHGGDESDDPTERVAYHLFYGLHSAQRLRDQAEQVAAHPHTGYSAVPEALYTREEVNEAWETLRRHNRTIPDECLDEMRDVLLAAAPEVDRG